MNPGITESVVRAFCARYDLLFLVTESFGWSRMRCTYDTRLSDYIWWTKYVELNIPRCRQSHIIEGDRRQVLFSPSACAFFSSSILTPTKDVGLRIAWSALKFLRSFLVGHLAGCDYTYDFWKSGRNEPWTAPDGADRRKAFIQASSINLIPY